MMRPYMYINAQLTVMSKNEFHYDQLTMYSLYTCVHMYINVHVNIVNIL